MFRVRLVAAFFLLGTPTLFLAGLVAQPTPDGPLRTLLRNRLEIFRSDVYGRDALLETALHSSIRKAVPR